MLLLYDVQYISTWDTVQLRVGSIGFVSIVGGGHIFIAHVYRSFAVTAFGNKSLVYVCCV